MLRGLGDMEKFQRYDPLTLQMAESLLKFKAAGGGTKEERDASRKALAQVRFLKTAYRLFWKTKYDPKLAPHFEGKLGPIEQEVKKAEDELEPIIDKLMPRRQKRPPPQ